MRNAKLIVPASTTCGSISVGTIPYHDGCVDMIIISVSPRTPSRQDVTHGQNTKVTNAGKNIKLVTTYIHYPCNYQVTALTSLNTCDCSAKVVSHGLPFLQHNNIVETQHGAFRQKDSTPNTPVYSPTFGNYDDPYEYENHVSIVNFSQDIKT